MRPEVWGPHGWIFLHSITMNYPEKPNKDDKKKMKKFFKSVQYVLPCNSCSKHLQKHMEKNPLTDEILESRTDLIKWLMDIHNEANKAGGKKVLSHKEAYIEMRSWYE
jgi:hypothetical protein